MQINLLKKPDKENVDKFIEKKARQGESQQIARNKISLFIKF